MKTNLSILTGVASLAALMQGAVAQSATTEPVGYITINVNPSSSGLSFIAPTLVNKVEYSGAISTITASTIGVSGTPFTNNQFDKTASGLARYYVELTSGVNAGAWTNVGNGTTTSAITTEDDMDVIANPGDTIRIRKHVTVNDFFGADNSIAGFKSGEQLSDADQVKLYNNETKNPKTLFFYDDGIDQLWVTSSFGPAGDEPIEPGSGAFVQRKLDSALTFTRTGHVKTGPTKITVDSGLNLMGVTRAVGEHFTFDSSGLHTGSTSTGVQSGEELATADVLKIFQSNGQPKSFFYYDDGVDALWVASNFAPAGTEQLKEGTSFLIVRQGAAFPWTVPAESIAP